MKKIFATFFIFLFFYVNINLTGLIFANNKYNSEINSAKLLETHVAKLKKQLNLFIKRYEVGGDKIIKDSLKKLGIIDRGLKEIKNKKVSGTKASKYISIIVKSLRSLNNRLNPHLKDIIRLNVSEVNKYKTIFNKKIKPFIPKIKNLIVTLATKIQSKKSISNKDKDVIKLLTYINNYVDNINNFEFKSFSTKTELKTYLLENIKNIKKDILHIKRLYK